ncbi:unnamed protein product [Diamesa tonsa]
MSWKGNQKKEPRKSGNFERPKEPKGEQQLDNEDFDYIKEICKNMTTIQDDESQNLMADNVFETISTKEIKFASNCTASRAVDSLIPYTSAETFEAFTTVLASDFRILCNDKFASFVLEKCVKVATLRALSIKEEEDPSDDDEAADEPEAKRKKIVKVSTDVEYNLKVAVKHSHKVYCSTFLEKVSKFLLNNLEDYLYQNFAGHIIRSCLLCLSGTVAKTTANPKAPEYVDLKALGDRVFPESWSEIVSDYASRLMSWPQFSELPYTEPTSVVLQTLIKSLKNIEGLKSTRKELINAVLKNSFDDELAEGEEYAKIFQYNSSCHLLEVIIMSCSEKQTKKIYKKFFKDNLVKMSESGSLNFAVQKLIDSITDKELFEEVFTALSDDYANILKVGHTGVIFSLCKACERLGVKQGQFIQNMLKALECTGDKAGKCILPIIKLVPLEVSEKEDKLRVNLHGSLILQNIFQFNKPIKIIQSLLEMKPHDVAEIFCDIKGSRIADAFLESKFVGEKSREKLFKHLDGLYMQFATSKSGSHVMEKMYALSSDTQREAIVCELSSKMAILNGSMFGRIINRKLCVEMYLRNRTQWKASSACKSR